jgi:hypothetical protein
MTPSSSLKRVKIGRRSWVKFGSRLTNHVRAGERYLVATPSCLTTDDAKALNAKRAECATSGLFLYSLDVPRSITPQFLVALKKLSLGYGLRAQVDPFGLVPRWDASLGGSMWLPNEEILLRISADFDASEFFVSMDGAGRTRFPLGARKEIIVSVGRPVVGRHVVEIGATAARDEQAGNVVRTVSPETIFVEVRPPVPWQRGIRRQAGLRAVLEPAAASLEDLINKRASLSVHGPAERTAKMEARLFDNAGHVAESTEIGRIDLPASDAQLARAIEKLATEPLSEKIQSAPRIDLVFISDELGVAAVSFPHKIPPLRWKLVDSAGRPAMRLVDEAGTSQTVCVDRYDFRAPDKRIGLDPGSCFAGVPVEPPGSLFIARNEGYMYGAVASVVKGERLTAFSDLGVNIALSAQSESPRQIMKLLGVLRLWRAGRVLLGPLATVRKGKVIEVVERQIERLACGNRWAERVQRYRSGNIRSIEELQGDVGGSPGFAWRVRTTEWTWASDNARARSEFLRIAKTYKVSMDSKLCDLALRLAFHPATIKLDDQTKGAEVFEDLGKNSAIARGAYFAKLTSDLRFQSAET